MTPAATEGHPQPICGCYGRDVFRHIHLDSRIKHHRLPCQAEVLAHRQVGNTEDVLMIAEAKSWSQQVDEKVSPVEASLDKSGYRDAATGSYK